MKSVLAVLLLLSLSSARLSGLHQQPVTDIMDVITGLIKGLELDSNSPGACANDLTSTEGDINAVISDIERIIGGDEMAMLQLLTDGEAMLSTLKGSNSDCKWSQLLAEFESLSTEAGQKQILANVMGNMGEIFADAKGLANCPTDLTGCGFQIGQIFRLVFNWGITAPRVRLTQVSSFMNGFYQGIQTPGGDGTCVTDVESLSGLFSTIYQDAEKALGGSMSAAVDVFTNLKKLLSDIDSDNSECNIEGFFKMATSLTTAVGWAKVAINVGENWPAIDAAAQTMNTCSTNPTQCGFSVGEILRLSLDWGLGPSSLRQSVEITWFDAFLSGLQSNPNSASGCVSSLDSLQPLIVQVIQDIEKVANDYSLVFQLISDAKQLAAKLQSCETPCNIPELLTILNKLNTPTGYMILLNNFKQNSSQIMGAFPAILNCGNDVATCGQNSGIVLRLLIGWSI